MKTISKPDSIHPRSLARSIAKANMKRLGSTRGNRLGQDWRKYGSPEATDKAIEKALGASHFKRFRIWENKLKTEKERKKAKRRAA